MIVLLKLAISQKLLEELLLCLEILMYYLEVNYTWLNQLKILSWYLINSVSSGLLLNSNIAK
jgi:hypothetical protein